VVEVVVHKTQVVEVQEVIVHLVMGQVLYKEQHKN
jgi:hypothetical protein